MQGGVQTGLPKNTFSEPATELLRVPVRLLDTSLRAITSFREQIQELRKIELSPYQLGVVRFMSYYTCTQSLLVGNRLHMK